LPAWGGGHHHSRRSKPSSRAAFLYYQTPRLISRNPFSPVGTEASSTFRADRWAVGWIPKVYNGRDRTFFFTSIESEQLGS
jgi:hypothetical protein